MLSRPTTSMKVLGMAWSAAEGALHAAQAEMTRLGVARSVFGFEAGWEAGP